jgi:hypothetical protein
MKQMKIFSVCAALCLTFLGAGSLLAQDRVWAFAGAYNQPGYAGDGYLAYEKLGPFTFYTPNPVKIIPTCMTFDKQGNLYVGSQNVLGVTNATAIRKIDAATRIITTVAGNGRILGQLATNPPYNGLAALGPNGPSAAVTLGTGPVSLAYREADKCLYACTGAQIVKINLATNTVTTFAGKGTADGPDGDGGTALNANIGFAPYIAFNAAENTMYVASAIATAGAGPLPVTLRKIDMTTNIITKVADLPFPAEGLAIDGSDNAYISSGGWKNPGDSHIIKITPGGGSPIIVAGGDSYQGTITDQVGDNAVATEVYITQPRRLAFDPGYANLYFTDYGYVRKLNMASGRLSRVVGISSGPSTLSGFPKNGEVAIDGFNFNYAQNVAVHPVTGTPYVSDNNYMIYQVSPSAPTSSPVVSAVGTIECSKTQLSPAPVAGTAKQVDLVVTLNVTTAGCFNGISVSGSGMSVANGATQVCATTTGVQTFHIPLNYDGTGLGTMSFTVGSAGSCSADLTQTPKQAICPIWTLDCVPTDSPELK